MKPIDLKPYAFVGERGLHLNEECNFIFEQWKMIYKVDTDTKYFDFNWAINSFEGSICIGIYIIPEDKAVRYFYMKLPELVYNKKRKRIEFESVYDMNEIPY